MALGEGGLRVGRISGIDVTIDRSWVFIFLLVTWSLAVGVFPHWHPRWSSGLDWGIACAAAVLFFVSILLHELAHSLVAKARGLPVNRIALFLFGGVSNLEREPPSPATEFVMAFVGPLTSIALGIVFLLLSGILDTGALAPTVWSSQVPMMQMSPLSTLLMWLGQVNILVGMFNLVPGFPLDGGRVVRSIIWAATNNLRKATLWAARLGQGIAWVFVVSGIAMVFGVTIPGFGSGIIGGLWLAFIGWFLNNAAVASNRQVLIDDVLQDIPVSRLMRPTAAGVPPDTRVSSLVHDWIMGTDERAFLVMDGERLLGLVCLEDVRKVPRDQWDNSTVTQIMTPAGRLITATPEEHVAEALRKLTRNDVRQLPVMEGNRLAGLLRLADVVKWLHLHEELH
jgi:Zn-dependent protease/CBS domain-containing protein